jgi:hypothetical protein
MKRTLFNFVVLTTLMVLLLFGLTSCTTVTTPTTGIVTITLEIGPVMGVDLERTIKNYYIYMDDTYQGMMTDSGALTLEDVPLGIHTFDASDYLQAGISFIRNIDIDSQEDSKDKAKDMVCSGYVIYEVKLGINYVTIPVNCDLLITIE